MDLFDIFVAYVSWGDSGKNRPVLVIELKEKIVSVFNITTQYQAALSKKRFCHEEVMTELRKIK